MQPPILTDNKWIEEFTEALNLQKSLSSWKQYNMAFETAQKNMISDFQTLEAPKQLPQLTFHDYQYDAARKALNEMNGRAILADEVGLGKTIEAGLILKEYMIRGLVKKVLILAPASLVTQWCAELNSKFYIPAVEQRKKPQWETVDIMVTSIDTAKRGNHAEIIKNIDYDMVIIDEAHKLKNKKTKNYQFVREVKKKFCLLLTATPVQNKLSELFHLISLLKPGYLGDEEAFNDYFQRGEHYGELQELIKKVMIRNRRDETEMDWPKRIVQTVPVRFSSDYHSVYQQICQLKQKMKEEYLSPQSGFLVLTLQREFCSSREAVFMTLKNAVEKREMPSEQMNQEFLNMMTSLNHLPSHPKADKVLDLINSWEKDEKVVIFTEYRATQLYLQWFLGQHGIRSVPFRGGFKRSKKDWMRQLFQNQAQVLIATEAGGEGINLQFCHRIINYDLPWNPMRIEQRIGRLHRLGQEKDVNIYHLAVENTIEDHILKLLYKKIGLFEGVIGELDHILEKFGSNHIQSHLSSIFSQSESEGEMRIKLDHLSSIVLEEENEEATHATN
ncbi:DEAD/DEAH box helicase [Salipaludibacillus sp. CUR1]|uniref:DEAD/DEAH box helicase n=1 Tax=Salipaludibacillus sp. CUR1 TaxID=2820003 RepID=UPI001F3ADFFF|nr:SNF2-related protein [Salipaludibacillus sp. CUR1]